VHLLLAGSGHDDVVQSGRTTLGSPPDCGELLQDRTLKPGDPHLVGLAACIYPEDGQAGRREAGRLL
jgi:hypothetical protein